jgi:hypothetical protein
MLWDAEPYSGLYEKYFYPAPISGPIHIVDATNPRVVVESKSGERATFDAEQRKWTD